MPFDRRSLSRQHDASVLVLALVAVGAVTVVLSAVLHLYLWGRGGGLGYRDIHTVGPLFLVQGIVGCILGLAMFVLRRAVTTAIGAMYMAASLGGLLLSLNGGLFGYDESLDADYVKVTLAVEIIGLVACLLALATTFARHEAHTT
ncbi:MAG TPA: hypothetical protein VGC84_03520 [Ilumatobacteraceae bacterium]|jgi:hypothetical protein